MNNIIDSYEKPDDSILRKMLTPLQYAVTQLNATEPPFKNEYWNEHRPGLYIDITSGEPLFISRDKFDSGCGWPSFTKPVNENAVQIIPDNSMGMQRMEVRSSLSNAHLGHVFNDGPSDCGGLRYCINSAALSFIPAEELEQKGYGKYYYMLKL
ncbi:MAG: peptide-methionine (R)-S-oxide reductase MsrB [Muribaculaceae bacterium]|nr:peptide-methionine (R)-S-oxide reductase MsrB [Muribaculaceae bacterium]